MTIPRRAAAGLCAGLLLTFSLPPFGWWPLGIAGVAMLSSALRERPAPARFAVGAGAGVGLFAVSLWWMKQFSLPGYVLAALGEALLFAAPVMFVSDRRGRIAGLAAALVLAEFVHTRWPFGGVPMGGIGLGQAGGPLLPAARLGGELLVVALTGIAGAGLAALLDRRHRRPVAAAVAVVAVVLVTVLGTVAPRGRSRSPMRVALVQGGGVRGTRAIFSDPALTFAAQLRASRSISPPVDLVVWPEDVIDVTRVAGSLADVEVAALAQRLGATVVAGVVEDSGEHHFLNAAVAWAPDGRRVSRYEKVHRVPFGEYVPARGLIEHLADLSAVPRDALPGHGAGIVITPAGRLGVLLSYEVFFARRARSALDAGASVLLVPTNAASFRDTQVPGQELAAARLRAVESGRWVLQAAPTGYTAAVDARGRVRGRSQLGTPALLQLRVSRRSGSTAATRIGETPVALVALIVLVLAGFGARREPR